MPTPAAASPLATAVVDDLVRYFRHMESRVERAVRSLPREGLWVKPFAFGNSVGHLVLHLTGNLNHYVGALIARTGYVRDRPREFTEASPPPPEGLMARFHEAVGMVMEPVRSLDADGWMTTVAEQPPVQTRFGLI